MASAVCSKWLLIMVVSNLVGNRLKLFISKICEKITHAPFISYIYQLDISKLKIDILFECFDEVKMQYR